MATSINDINGIYSEYFEIIDSYFGSIKHHLGDGEDSHIDLGEYIARYPLVSDLIIDAIDDIDDQIDAFWEKNLRVVVEYIQKQESLKCLYSGDITPVILENFVKRSALYIDSVILPDPLYNLAILQKQIVQNKKYYLQKLIRHVFNVWKLKDLVLSETPQKVLFVLPINLHLVNEKDRARLVDEADKKYSAYVGKIFDIPLEDEEACSCCLEKVTTVDDLFKQFKRPELLPRVFASQGSLNNFLTDFSQTGRFVKFRDKESVGADFGLYLRSQFIRVQEHKYFCDRLVAEPIYDYELPWFFFNYEMGGVDMDAAIATSLQNEKFNWISKVPLPAIAVMRAENKLEYMRSVLRQGITDLKAKNDKDLIKVGEQLEANLRDAFAKQEAEIKALQAQANKIVRLDMPITSAGFLAGFLPPPYSTFFSFLSAGRDMHKSLAERASLEAAIEQKRQHPMSILLKSYER